MSIPQSAPALGQPAPLRRKFSGHDEKVTNLMKAFPTVPEEAIRQELHNVGGHASKARNAIQKKYMATTPPATPSGGVAASPATSPAVSPNTTPMPVSKEPADPVPASSEKGEAPQPRDLAPPRSAPVVMEQPQRAAKLSQPTAGQKGEALENLKSRFPDQDHDVVQGALKQAGGHAGKAAMILSKGGVAAGGKAADSKRNAQAALGGKADTGKVDVFLASLSKSELKRVVADVEKVLGAAPSATKIGTAAATPAAARNARSVEKKQGASCFKMLGHICAADGAKGAKAQQRADAMGL